MLTHVIRAVRVAVWLLVTAIWSVVGFLVWVPLLVRVVAAYATAVLISALTDRPLTQIDEALDSAIQFYPGGFTRINNILSRPTIPTGRSSPIVTQLEGLSKTEQAAVAIHLVWTAVFWGVLLYGLIAALGMS